MMKNLIICRVVLVAMLTMVGLDAGASLLFTTNYGNYSATTVNYNQVTESSGTDANALFNAPSVTGDTLDFNPTFSAYSNNGENGGIDTTDGQLGFNICAKKGCFVDELVFSERGDYTLSSFGNIALVDVSASFHIEVLSVDGVELASPVNETYTMIFSPNADGTFQLSGIGVDDGTWSGDISIDIEDLLILNSIEFECGATKLHIELDNTLTAMSQESTSAFIAKKDFQGFSVTAIPEPNSLVLIGLASSVIVFVRSRFFI